MSDWLDDLARRQAARHDDRARPSGGLVGRATTRRTALKAAVAALLAGPLRGLASPARAAAEGYCYEPCKAAANQRLGSTVRFCLGGDHDISRTKQFFAAVLQQATVPLALGCLAGAYGAGQAAVGDCRKPSCGDASRYPKPTDPGGGNWCQTCMNAGGKCVICPTGPHGVPYFCANPTLPDCVYCGGC